MFLQPWNFATRCLWSSCLQRKAALKTNMYNINNSYSIKPKGCLSHQPPFLSDLLEPARHFISLPGRPDYCLHLRRKGQKQKQTQKTNVNVVYNMQRYCKVKKQRYVSFVSRYLPQEGGVCQSPWASTYAGSAGKRNERTSCQKRKRRQSTGNYCWHHSVHCLRCTKGCEGQI